MTDLDIQNGALGGGLPLPSASRSKAVTAAGIAFIVLALLAARRFIGILSVPLQTRLKLTAVVFLDGVYIIAITIFAIAASATILRWRRWRIWAGAAGWLAISLAVWLIFQIEAFSSIAPQVTRNPQIVPPFPAAQLILPVLTLVISMFVLWARRQEEDATTNAGADEVTVAGLVLLLIGIEAIVWVIPLSISLASSYALLVRLMAIVGAFFLIFAFAGSATILRWRGWRAWAGTVAWLVIGIVVIGCITELRNLAMYGPTFLNVRYGEWTLLAFLGSVSGFVLWAKRQEKKALASS